MYRTFYRPVPVEEHLVHENKIYLASSTRSVLNTASRLQPTSGNIVELGSQPIRTIQTSQHKELRDPVLNAVVALANETVIAGYGVLVFCNSRQGCESDARLISKVLPQVNEVDSTVLEKRTDLLGDLRSLPMGLDHNLAETIPVGVAFHHAGMTTEERDLISTAYDSGVLKAIVATCSLAAGINLPARRVILHNARMGRNLIGPSMLRQMRGRAGRKGKDEIGETYLCCRKSDLEDVVELMRADLPHISSSLTTDKHRIQRALLEAVSIRLINSRESISDYIRKTLLNLSGESDMIRERVESSLQDLLKMEFIQCDDSESFVATQLGKAVVASSLEPEDGAFVHRELQRALQAFVMVSPLKFFSSF